MKQPARLLKAVGFGVRQTWVQILTLPLAPCVTLFFQYRFLGYTNLKNSNLAHLRWGLAISSILPNFQF